MCNLSLRQQKDRKTWHQLVQVLCHIGQTRRICFISVSLAPDTRPGRCLALIRTMGHLLVVQPFHRLGLPVWLTFQGSKCLSANVKSQYWTCKLSWFLSLERGRRDLQLCPMDMVLRCVQSLYISLTYTGAAHFKPQVTWTSMHHNWS